MGRITQTSPATPTYNCIAWSAKNTHRWFWPGPDSYWPDNIPREETLQAFIMLYESMGYEICDNDSQEDGYEKVAIFVDQFNKPTHAARQVRDGRWSSKLGQSIDIEHDLQDVTPFTLSYSRGRTNYGRVAQILKRPVIV